MPSDDLLSPSMFACTLDETGVDGYRPAALRLLEAHEAARRERVRVLRDALEALTIDVEEMVDQQVNCGDPYAECPLHDCHKPGNSRDLAAAARAALAAYEPKEPK